MHGCFWHRHPGCKLARMPKSRIDFWRKKLDANRQRDLQNQTRLRNMGWRVLVVWECQLGDTSVMSRIVREFLNNQWGERDNDEIS
jgi:DNA mismatch endonuclease (patch repair protein)